MLNSKDYVASSSTSRNMYDVPVIVSLICNTRLDLQQPLTVRVECLVEQHIIIKNIILLA